MKNLLMLVIASVMLVGCKSSDSYIRDRVVQLKSEKGSCSGIKIETSSHKYYILTAGHCRILQDADKKIQVIDEDGRKHMEDVIAEDGESDLLLLSNDKKDGIRIADEVHRTEHVRSINHGKGLASYKQEGEIVEDKRITLATGEMVTDQKSQDACMSDIKNKMYPTPFGVFCVMDVMEAVTTLKVVPGSSGGGVVDDKGNLVAIVSATDGDFGYLVRLTDIKSFLDKH